jgi:phospholipid transport system transporter-binding protein
VARRSLRVDPAARPASLDAAGPGRFVLSGDVGFANAAAVLAAGDDAFGALPHADIDLARIEHVDSAALALLLEWSAAAREAGRAVSYRNVPAAVSALAGLSEVEDMLASGGGDSGSG